MMQIKRTKRMTFLVFAMTLCLATEIISVPTVTASCNLEIFDKNGEKNESLPTCVKEYVTENCSEFVKTFNQTLLPSNLQNKVSISKPMDIMLNPLRTFDKRFDIWIPGVNITWRLPFDGISKSHLQGFLFSFEWTGHKNGSLCRMFELSPSPEPDSQMMFRYSFSRIFPQLENTVKIYSLPAPPPGVHTNSHTYELARMTSGETRKRVSEPGYYYPSISVQAKNGKLKVVMDRSPPEFNFTQYNVKIIKRSFDEANTFDDQIKEAEVASEGNPIFSFFLQVPESDEYKVMIRPVDPYKMQKDKCLCWKKDLSNETYCENVCNQVDSPWIQVDVPSISTTVSPETTAQPSSDQSEDKDDNTTLIIVVLVLTILFIIVALGLCMLLHRRNCLDKEKCLSFCRVYKSSPSTSFNAFKPGGKDTSLSECKKLSTKSVLILYAVDNEAHQHLMDCWAKFLKVHCHCNVLYHPWHDILPDDSYQWLVKSMQADIILVVGSEAAEKLIDALMEKQMYRSYNAGPDGDLFTLGIKWLLTVGNDPKIWDNVVLVNFDDQDWCRRYLLTPAVYHLPQCLPKVLKKIHGLSSRMAEGASHNLPLHVENLPALSEGSDLLSAVKAAKQYTQDHPYWLEEQLGTPTPIFIKSLSCSIGSGDSGCGSLMADRMISVSTQDVSFSDSSGSPQSVLEKPMFPNSCWSGNGQHRFRRSDSTKSQPCSSTIVKELPVTGEDLQPPPYSPTEPPSISSGMSPAGEVYSVVTVGTEWLNGQGEGSICPTITSNLTASSFKVIPPESASTILQGDSVSTALHQINERTEARSSIPREQPTVGQPDSDSESVLTHDYRIIPPDALSDILSENLSMGFTEINRASDGAIDFQNTNCGLEVGEDEETEDGRDFDTVSV